MAEVKIGSIRNIYCNSCKAKTHHELLSTHTRQIQEIAYEDTPNEQISFWERWEYRFWVCRGCDTALLEVRYTCDGMYNEKANDFFYESIYYPKREKTDWIQKQFRHLDLKLEEIYREVIICFNADAKMACAICLRSLLEGICVNGGITDQEAWGLEDKLKKAKENEYLPPNIADCLLSFKFIGDDAAHKLVATTHEELEMAISVMEDLLNFLYEAKYELVFKAQKLAKLRSTEIEKLKNRKVQTDHTKNKKVDNERKK